ncbi:hypothetical protein DZK27_10490 [Rhodobacteraceae bacterium 63075]|nr:hypothetical protein DZK27_10490 [Rhodobacteraceae bacterium 63075]
MKPIWKILKFIRRFATSLMFIVMFGVFLASHTIASLALITNTVIEAVSGVSTIAADALTANADLKEELDKKRARIDSLEDDLDTSNAKNKELKAAQKKSAKKIKSLEANLIETKRANQVTFRGKKMSAREAALESTRDVSKRTRRVAFTNLGSVFGESIPFYGIAIIVGATTYELKSSCDNMKDMHDLRVALDPEAAIPEDRDAVCGLQVPTKEEIWERIKSSPSDVWDKVIELYEGTVIKLPDLEMPDFDGIWHVVVDRMSRWLDWAS